MAPVSKKEVRKANKGKGKAEQAPVKAVNGKKAPVVKAAEPEVSDEEDEWESEEDEDEDNGGVSEKGMKRLMELVGEEDLDDLERATLAVDDDEDEESGEEEEEDDEDEEAEEDEEVGELSGESDDEEEDEDEDMAEVSQLYRSGPRSTANIC
jgi:rRNA-processing protein EBP2